MTASRRRGCLNRDTPYTSKPQIHLDAERLTLNPLAYRGTRRGPCTGSTSQARTPKPSNLTPEPSSLRPHPSTLNPQPSSLNPQPSSLNPQPSTRRSSRCAPRPWGTRHNNVSPRSAGASRRCNVRNALYEILIQYMHEQGTARLLELRRRRASPRSAHALRWSSVRNALHYLSTQYALCAASMRDAAKQCLTTRSTCLKAMLCP